MTGHWKNFFDYELHYEFISLLLNTSPSLTIGLKRCGLTNVLILQKISLRNENTSNFVYR